MASDECPGGCEDTGPAEVACPSGPVDVGALDPAERLQALAALTARFSASYLRFMGGRGQPLSYPRLRVLERLADGPAIMRDLAEALGMTARNITAIVDALEEAGLAVRVPHPNDRRATVVRLTEAGRCETDRARGESLDKVACAFGELSLEDQQRYADMLSRLSAVFCR